MGIFPVFKFELRKVVKRKNPCYGSRVILPFRTCFARFTDVENLNIRFACDLTDVQSMIATFI